MAGYRYPTIKVISSTETSTRESSLGRSNTARLSSIFRASPIYGDVGREELETAQTYREYALKKLLSGIVTQNGQTGPVDLNYGATPGAPLDKRPPDFKSDGDDGVKVGGGGRPASPWVPNPTAPGEGSVDPTMQAPAPEGYGTVPSTTLSNIGYSSTAANTEERNPLTSSRRMSLGQEVGEYTPGQSPATSNVPGTA